MPFSDFAPDDSRFSFAKLTALLRAASLAYETDPEVLDAALRDEFGSVDVWPFASEYTHLLGIAPDFKIQHTQGYLAADATKIILAFRGTEGERDGALRDWASDLLIQQTRFSSYFATAPDIGAVHSGFGKALRDVWTKVAARLRQMRERHPDATLWITGHSLGGAIAVLAAAACYYETAHQSPVAGVYTFGQPRVGDLVFRTFHETALGARTYFVVNNHDIVTRVPPRSFPCVPGLNFATTGRLVFLGEDGHATNDSTAWHRFTLTDKVGWDGVARLRERIAEHAVAAYARAIEAASADLKTLTW